MDVYDLAASIGKDFEKLIEKHGNDCVLGIMPKVCLFYFIKVYDIISIPFTSFFEFLTPFDILVYNSWSNMACVFVLFCCFVH